MTNLKIEWTIAAVGIQEVTEGLWVSSRCKLIASRKA